MHTLVALFWCISLQFGIFIAPFGIQMLRLFGIFEANFVCIFFHFGLLYQDNLATL
jgi:hypothetical protein